MLLPALDLQQPAQLATATFSLGCFWGPDARFGVLPGVVRTRVGYAGGSTENPTYRTLEEHIETLQLDYDPAQISYQELLEHFFQSHTPTKPAWKRQYASAVFHHTPEQEQLFLEAKERIEKEKNSLLYTIMYPFPRFYQAEQRHQKYRLQRHPTLLQEYRTHYPALEDFIASTAVARANGYLQGSGSLEQLKKELPLLGLSPEGQLSLLEVYSTH